MMTPEGHQALAVLLNTWNEMANAVHQITQNINPIASSEASSALS